MESKKKYWKGLEEYNNTAEYAELNKNEFAEPLPLDEVLNGTGLNAPTPRRDFLKAVGFGLGAVTLAACQPAPVHKSIPYLVKPEDVMPGIPNYYVSSYKGSSVLVKTREGRPIKLDVNPAGGRYLQGTDAATQAAVLDLYDVARLKNPLYKKKEDNWKNVDRFVTDGLQQSAQAGKQILIISKTILSPSTLATVARFTQKYPTTKLVQYDAVSYAGIINANQASFGKPVLPKYNLQNADVVVGVGADFLGTFLSGEEASSQYISNRNNAALKSGKMSRHIQFESGLSMTGTNADSRIAIKPSQEAAVLTGLYNIVAGSGAVSGLSNAQAAAVKLAAAELKKAQGRAVVICGTNNAALQTITNAINAALGAYGQIIDLDHYSKMYQGSDAAYSTAVADMAAGRVGAVFFLNSNPVYNNPKAADFRKALAQVPLKVSFSAKRDETADACDIVAIGQHFLETWGDESLYNGYHTIVQPTINPLFNSRQAEVSLLTWAGEADPDYYKFVRNYWEQNVLTGTGMGWKDVLQKGFAGDVSATTGTAVTFAGNVGAAIQEANARAARLDKNFQLNLYENAAMRDGDHANNPLLQEMPDAVSKVTWDNYVAMSPADAKKLDLAEFDLVKVSNGAGSVVLPVLYQPGQANGSVSIALGYGRTMAGKVGNAVGKNAYPLATLTNGVVDYQSSVTVEKAGGRNELAQTQTHHSYEGRDVVRTASFAEYKKNPASGSGNEEKGKHKSYDLWPRHEKVGYSWVMAIDLNACTGCGACIVACNVENNVPVVGKDEVKRRREMHWLRIDRYYTYNEGGKAINEENEIAALANTENVSVIHQPMLCQHCDHAPCETVCPVLATTHSSDGLNMMAYNRCVGTRYCANNCPYKVRRFNWFNYWNDSRFDNYLNNEFTHLALNPDVTSRSRGVMEKCSMCVQNIQAAKLQAQMEKRVMRDGDVKIACASACATNAIIFGDRMDPNSRVSKALADERTYYVLEELNVKPGIGYMTRIQNIDPITQA